MDLKKENVHLDEQYFDVISSKTENEIRKVRFLLQTRSYLTTKLGLKIIRNASTLSIHRMANTSNTEIFMIATSIH